MKNNIFFFIILCIWGVIYMGLALYIWFSKKAIGFCGSKKMFDVTDIRKYNHAMSKLYAVHGLVYIFLGFPLLTGHHKWIIFSVAGVVVETIIFIVVYLLVIKKKYKRISFIKTRKE